MAAARCPSLVLMLLLSCTCCGAASAAADEKLTHLHFYFHEVDAGPNVTLVTVASLHKNASTFGDLNVFDNALREGPDPAQGAGDRGARVAGRVRRPHPIDFVFSDYGEYSGSTLATQGRLIVSGPSEHSIVGGTGKLRFARGYMISKFLSSTNTSSVYVFDMYFTLAH